ncbi:MAG: acetate--CoA ligase family protein, partial [Alphaproteobacteria bacterium]
MSDLSALFSPNSIAIIGASPDEHKLRGLLLHVMLTHPYTGKIYPVSRSHDEVMGLKAYSTIGDIPAPVDLAVMVIPSQYVLSELERCGDAGVRAVLIITSGFAEQAGEDGKAMQASLREIADRYAMAVMGPNSEGFANISRSLALTFSPALNAPEKPLLPPWHKDGRIAVVAQSGAVGFSFFDRGQQKELPFGYVITTGNEACLEIFDVVDYLLDEGKTDVFILFLEDIKNAETFKRVAEKALRAGKPIIAAKLGQSEAAERATASHTGALAGNYAIYAAMLDHYGIIHGADTEQMVDIANGFLTNAHRLPKGRRIGICTGSGGAGAWMADACAAEGLEVPELDAQARAEIDTYLPAYGTSQNPVDGTAQAIREIGYAELARLVSKSNNVDGVVMVTSARKKNGYDGERENIFRVARECEKPIVCWSYTWPHQISSELFAEAGLPLHTNMRNCARTMAALVHYRAFCDRALETRENQSSSTAQSHQNRMNTGKSLGKAGRFVCEYEAKNILAAYGIGTSSNYLVANADEAIAVADKLDGKVVLKIQSPDILHKTDSGGVALNLETAEEIRTACDTMIENARTSFPDAEIKGILVEPMAAAGIEVILGVNHDPKFGPMLMVGLGGIHVEVLGDVAFAPVPLAHTVAHELLRKLKGAHILDGLRGTPASDIGSLVELMVSLSHFAADHADTIAEIDLNPIIVHSEGNGVSV